MDLEELSFLEEEKDEEDFETMLEKEKNEVEKILQSLEPSRLRED